MDAASEVGAFSSLVLDSNDYPHISYRDSNWTNLKYAKWTGSLWVMGPVDAVGNVGQWTSLALDSSDHPHISYYDIDNRDLKYTTFYATTNLSVQITTSVDTIGEVGGHSSIAIDSLDRPHISYVDFTHQALKYAWWNGSAWNIETVDDPPNYVGDTSLALDSSDRPRISYSADEVKYARWTGTTWNIEIVENVTNTHNSLVLDSDDNPHISYNDWSTKNLKYARWTGSAWSIETVDAALTVGEFCSLALDSNDYPHISYYDAYWQDLKYAGWNGTSWFIKNIDHLGDVGNWGTSIAIDSHDNPHISYHDYTNRNLKYAQDPDEYFYDVGYAAFDSNGDGFHDGVEVWMDVDTTYLGPLNISVQGFLTDEVGMVQSSNRSSWEITGISFEHGYVHLYLPAGAPEGWYDIGLALYDERFAIEGGRLFHDAAYLYPPNMQALTIQVSGAGSTSPSPGTWWATQDTELEVLAIPDSGWILDHWVLDSGDAGTDNPISITLDSDHVLTAVFVEESQIGFLQGRVTDLDSHLPIVGAEVAVGDLYFSTTNGSGHYSMELPTGSYNVTVTEEVYNSGTALVSVIAGITTVQDFHLQRSHWILIMEVEGSGTTDPPPGGMTFLIGAEIPIQAFPAHGWFLDHWIVDSVFHDAVNPFFILMDTDHVVRAVFYEEAPTQPFIESCNSEGEHQDSFDLGQTVYVTGAGYPHSSSFDCYVVVDVESWIDGMVIPGRVSGTEPIVTSNPDGEILVTVVWSDTHTMGDFDVVIDVNGNGHYEVGVDALDNDDIEVTNGFIVIPELSVYSLLLLFLLTTLLAYGVRTANFGLRSRTKRARIWRIKDTP